MADSRVLERLTASDFFLLLWEDYGWSTDIGGLAILDGTSLLDDEGRVRVDAVRRHLEPRLHVLPRFRQLLHRPRLGLGWPLWVDAPCFDLADHIRVHPLPAPGDQDRLLQACQQLARRPFDPARPLWELWLLPGLPDRRVGAFQAASRPCRRPRRDGRLRGAARPERRGARPGCTAVDASTRPVPR